MSESNTTVMPNNTEKTVSMFEFWPAWLMYAPVVAQWIYLSARYRSLTLPFIANPKLTLSGMVGVGKSELLSTASARCNDVVLPWIKHTVTDALALEQAKLCVVQAAQQGIQLPFVCKPDIGCRGAGVKRISTVEQLAQTIAAYPKGADLLCQKLAQSEDEVGIFYVQYPGQKGKIVGLTLKSSPYVLGDGVRTLEQLVLADARAAQLVHLYQPRHQQRWQQILPAGERLRLVFSASHCRGAVFTDAREHITEALTEAIAEVMQGLPEFHYGRLDVKFASLEALRAGRSLEVVEINGASAESIHIWDRNAKLVDAWRTLMWQYRTLFELGAEQRKRGYKAPSLTKLLQHYRLERRLTQHYPLTD